MACIWLVLPLRWCCAGDNRAWIQELTDATLANIPDRVVVVAKASLSATISGGAKRRCSKSIRVKDEKPDWDAVDAVEGYLYHYK